MMKINTMYITLRSLIPENVACEPNTKPHSKLGVLKRAIVYWRSLSETLMQHPPPSVHSNLNVKSDNTDHSMVYTQHSASSNVPDRVNSESSCSSNSGQLRIKSEELWRTLWFGIIFRSQYFLLRFLLINCSIFRTSKIIM